MLDTKILSRVRPNGTLGKLEQNPLSLEIGRTTQSPVLKVLIAPVLVSRMTQVTHGTTSSFRTQAITVTLSTGSPTLHS